MDLGKSIVFIEVGEILLEGVKDWFVVRKQRCGRREKVGVLTGSAWFN